MILSVQVGNGKSRPPDNASLGCGIWQSSFSSRIFFSSPPPPLFPKFFSAQSLCGGECHFLWYKYLRCSSLSYLFQIVCPLLRSLQFHIIVIFTDIFLTLSHLGDLIHSQPGGGGGIRNPSVTLLSLIQIKPKLVRW